MEETISLAMGDLRWIFPGLRDPEPARAPIAEAEELLRDLASRLGAGPGAALEFLRVDGFTLPGLSGRVQAGPVSFGIWLGVPQRCLWEQRSGPPWEVTGSVDVICARGDRCGLHIVAESRTSHGTPVEAARALAGTARWLRDRGTAQPAGSWRAGIEPC